MARDRANEFGNVWNSAQFAPWLPIKTRLDYLGIPWNFSSESGRFNGLRGLCESKKYLSPYWPKRRRHLVSGEGRQQLEPKRIARRSRYSLRHDNGDSEIAQWNTIQVSRAAPPLRSTESARPVSTLSGHPISAPAPKLRPWSCLDPTQRLSPSAKLAAKTQTRRRRSAEFATNRVARPQRFL